MLRHEPKELYDTGEVALPRTRAERIGPYSVMREVARAPGARFVEAEGPGEAKVLLQVVRLRAPVDESDRLARQRYERSLGARTAALFDEPELEIRAQGGADVADGTRWIYWARAWTGAPVDGAVLAPLELERAARDLLERLVRRHARGRVDPLLDARTVWRASDERFTVAGVPIAVDAAWLAPGEPPPPRAKDERHDGDAAGDLWRLGQALIALTRGRADVPAALLGLIDALGAGEDATATERDPGRPTTAEIALGLLASPARAEAPAPTAPAEVPRTSVPPEGSWADAVASPGAVVPPRSTSPRPAAPRPSVSPFPARSGAEVAAHDAIDAATARIDLVPPPAPPAAVVQAPMDSAELETIEAAAPSETNTDPALGASDAVTHQTRPADPAPPSQPAIVPIDPSEVSTSTQRFFTVDTVTEGRALPRGGKVEDVDPAAVAWAPALLPEGASPWSEVVRPRSARPTFTGFSGELPALSPDDVAEPTAPNAIVRASEPPGPLTAMATVVAAPPARPAPAVGLTPARRMAVAAGATLLVLGLVAQWTRERGGATDGDRVVLSATSDVTVDAQPAGVTVVAEADGRVLGTTPMRFVVPAGADAAVILVRPGYDPQRLVLPDRGGIVAMLTPVAGEPCSLVVDASPGGALEGVGVDVGRGPRLEIPGAAVVRMRGEGGAGARIVRCADAPRDAPLRLRFGHAGAPANVRITHPAGATASIEGTEVGVVPAARAVVASFARVRVADASGEAVERWIPSTSDVEVQMPGAEAAVPEAPTPSVVEPTPIAVAPERADPRREPGRARPDAAALLREGNELLQAGHGDAARSRFEACLRADPAVAACHRGLAELFRRTEMRAEARSHYARYLELAPDAPDVALVKSLLREIE